MKTPNPWYGDGLSFSCTRCGNCCTGEPGYVWLNNEEIQNISSYLGMTDHQFRQQCCRMVGAAVSLLERANGDCILYDREAKGCKVYPVRPRQCQTWPFWESNLRSKGAWAETCRVCPGAGKGQHYSCAEIIELASVIQV